MATGNSILHANAISPVVVGDGDLKSALISKKDARSQFLADFAMEEATDRVPHILANFKNQRICILLRTTEINEIFRISSITIFVKPVSTGYPQ